MNHTKIARGQVITNITKVIGKKPVFLPFEKQKLLINVHAVKKYLIITLSPGDFQNFQHMPDQKCRKHNDQKKF